MAWSGQFVVSRDRILANPAKHYATLLNLLEAPLGHWVHDVWGPNDSHGPSNPAFGHDVERTWPIIFNCFDPAMARACTDEVAVKELCQCRD